MRLICTIEDHQLAKQFSEYLTAQGIENQLDGKVVTDWGNAEYGTAVFKIWVVDEDQAEKAYTLYQEFSHNPYEQRFAKILPKESEPAAKNPKIIPLRVKTAQIPKTPITHYLILLCVLLFIWGSIISPEFKLPNSSQSFAPVYTSPLKEWLLFDFPKTFELLARLIQDYGLDALQDPPTVPPEGAELIKRINQTPYWQGFYEEILNNHLGVEKKSAPWFEKISQGEVWRFFSPIFLHGDIFHLLFNMLWLFVLGKQAEIHLGPFRYLVFIAITAFITNTTQYLMSGPNFLGFSGVLCAMLTFIWKRQQLAPWEGYQLQRSTFMFVMLFIFGMATLQTATFLLEFFLGTKMQLAIANTAHLSGALLGLILAYIPFFTYERSQ